MNYIYLRILIQECIISGKRKQLMFAGGEAAKDYNYKEKYIWNEIQLSY